MPFTLTENELTAVTRLVDGKTPKEIADELVCSRENVYFLLGTARGQVGAGSTAELIAILFRRGVLR